MSRAGFTAGIRLLQSGLMLFTVVVAAAPQSPGDFEFFEKKIRPVLVEHCYQCHSATAEKLKGGLLLDSKEGSLKGGESGKPAIVPGDAVKSLLIEAIRYANEDLQMPPKKAGGKLSDEQIADFSVWINMGAPDPRSGKPATHNPQPATSSHWSFQSPKDSPVPRVKDALGRRRPSISSFSRSWKSEGFNRHQSPTSAP